MGILASTRDPHRRMRLLNRHRHDRALRNIEILALVGEGPVSALPDRRDYIERFFPACARLLVWHAEAAQLLLSGRPSGADLDPAVAQDIERRHALRDPHCEILREGKDNHHVADANNTSAL